MEPLNIRLVSSKNNRLYTHANVITSFGILFALAAIVFLWLGNPKAGLYCFVGAALSDLFDGITARYFERNSPGNGVSKLGEILDPFRDKLLLVVLLPLFPDWHFLLLVGIEGVALFFSTAVRKMKREHFISYTSKLVTCFQLLVIVISLFASIRSNDVIWAVILCSGVRLLSYGSEYWKISRVKGVS